MELTSNENKTIFVLIVLANSLMITWLTKGTQIKSDESVYLCMSMGWVFARSNLRFGELRSIERVKNVHHTTIISWVKQVGELLPQAYEPDVTPQVGELDELETYVRKKK